MKVGAFDWTYRAGSCGPTTVWLVPGGGGGQAIAALLTIYTGWDYLNSGIRHLVEEDTR